MASAGACFEHELPATTGGLPGLRRAFREWTRGVVADDAIGTDLVLAASEMCSTAIRLAAREGAPVLAVRAWLDGAAMVIEIRDPGGRVVEGGIRAVDADEGGRGLSIVATLADVFTVRAFGRGVLLRARKERVLRDPGHSVAGVR